MRNDLPHKDNLNMARSRVAVAYRRKERDAQEIIEARRDLAVAKLEAYIDKVVAEAPEFTPEQYDKLWVLLKPARENIRCKRLAELDAQSRKKAR
ncbi:hypothetical protein VST63_19150 [Mycolicibacterium sp. 050232]|uniref:hypothetical protein n=1 Tax=Mycolicibacterium sp. 050232 TaxID=3113982 RepID=UPI002E2BED98|nr:hypothetical protein [Mycolicibacterium sp. 050232]MED5814479.1 hypothetical protein [Mycolicibacterium sp. 050232]